MKNVPVKIAGYTKGKYMVKFADKEIFTRSELRYLIEIIDSKIGV